MKRPIDQQARARRAPRAFQETGAGLIEVMVASALVLIIFFGLSAFYRNGRMQLGLEEDRRRAVAIAQARLDGLRRDYRYDAIATLDGSDTTFVVDGRNFRVDHAVVIDTPESNAATVTVTVNWTAFVGTNPVDRAVAGTTILGRRVP